MARVAPAAVAACCRAAPRTRSMPPKSRYEVVTIESGECILLFVFWREML
jgi:hypothetical protein